MGRPEHLGRHGGHAAHFRAHAAGEPVNDSRTHDAISRLLEVMRRLRAPEGGCPWDREQDFASIVPYTIEESYEVADAIARGAPGDIEAELGDLLFQVVFHAQLG